MQVSADGKFLVREDGKIATRDTNADRLFGFTPMQSWMEELILKASAAQRIVPEVKQIQFNPPYTIVLWKDGTKTVVKAHDEEFCPEHGVANAFMRKMFGRTQFLKLVKTGTYQKHPAKKSEGKIYAAATGGEANI